MTEKNCTALQRHIPEELENPTAPLPNPKSSQSKTTCSNPSGEAQLF